ncbi:Elf1-domain-containing protein, partial [Polychaeton citri CBS 116435]
QKELLDTSFRCVFCNHETSVSVKIDKKSGIGTLGCKSCGQTYQTTTNYLSHPVDVYADWIDACDAVAQDTATTTVTHSRPALQKARPAASHREGLAPGEKRTDEDDGFIDDEGVDEDDLAAYGDD